MFGPLPILDNDTKKCLLGVILQVTQSPTDGRSLTKQNVTKEGDF